MLVAFESSVYETSQENQNKKELAYKITVTVFIRKMGGFGYKGKGDGFKIPPIPKTQPDLVVDEKTDAS